MTTAELVARGFSADAFIAEPAPQPKPETRRPKVVVDPRAARGQFFTLIEDFDWTGTFQGRDITLTAYAPFSFDGASVPGVIEALLNRLELGLLGPLFHDQLYRGGGYPLTGWMTPGVTMTRAECDKLFLQHMEEDGVSWLRRHAAYRAVRWFGGKAWNG